MLQRRGRFPADVRAQLERERLVLIAEGVLGTITRRADGPNGRARKRGTVAAVAISQQRLAVYGLGQPLVDVTWDSGDARDLDVTAHDDGLRIGFDDADGPGHTELMLAIGDSRALLAAIDQRRRELPPRRRLDREP